MEKDKALLHLVVDGRHAVVLTQLPQRRDYHEVPREALARKRLVVEGIWK